MRRYRVAAGTGRGRSPGAGAAEGGAHRILGDERFERRAEIAESCVRGAADALLKLPGSGKDWREPVGLKSAARALLEAVDTYQSPDASSWHASHTSVLRPDRHCAGQPSAQ